MLRAKKALKKQTIGSFVLKGVAASQSVRATPGSRYLIRQIASSSLPTGRKAKNFQARNANKFKAAALSGLFSAADSSVKGFAIAKRGGTIVLASQKTNPEELESARFPPFVMPRVVYTRNIEHMNKLLERYFLGTRQVI